MEHPIKISDFDYELPEERIAKFPLEERDRSKLLIYKDGAISESRFGKIREVLPEETLLVFNNTRVIRARIIMHKPSGARIEIFCLEPCEPSDYERAFAARNGCRWYCMVGNLRKWKEGTLEIQFLHEGKEYRLRALCEGPAENSGIRTAEAGKEKSNEYSGSHEIIEHEHVSSETTAPPPTHGFGRGAQIVRFEWDADLTFGEMLELLGRIPIPPYLCRESQEIDNTRYQTVYARYEGSVAAPTAGLHFTPGLLRQLQETGIAMEEVTLHVGAGTFLPVKEEEVSRHAMHTEHFEIGLDSLRNLRDHTGHVIPVGTTTVRTLESLGALAARTLRHGSPESERTVGQWEIYGIPASLNGYDLLSILIGYLERNGLTKLKASTQIMIAPGYRFRLTNAMITNFHQPRSTLLLLVSALVGEHWREIYDFALSHDFRFLSYGDSSILFG